MKQRILSVIIFGVGAVASARPVEPTTGPANDRTIKGFEENKGQVHTMDGAPAPFVRYHLERPGLDMFLFPDGIAYQFVERHYAQGSTEALDRPQEGADALREMERMAASMRTETYRMDMRLVGADPRTRITTEGESADFTNYYNHDALDVRHFAKLIYHDVYPGIDWVVYTTAEGVKYDFTVRPGADPSVIRMRFDHQEELRIEANGDLTHGNRMGRFTEKRPVSFQDGHEVSTRFTLEGNTLGFVVGPYDRHAVLTIDPPRIWGTYYGGSSIDEGHSTAVDASGNVYLAGETWSSAGIASGGYQNTIGGPGARDTYLVKFNGSGARLWATYYGGTLPETEGHCAVDNAGNVYLSGATYSTSAIASGGHQNAFGGQQDGFLVKFDANGTRQWATYYGGPGVDLVNACATDPGENVYIAGTSDSMTGIASGGHQNAIAGLSDAFLVKFNSAGVRQWATYHGGEAYDDAYGLFVSSVYGVFLTGSTASSGGMDTGFQAYGGGTDGYIASFGSNGGLAYSRYIGGAGMDMAYASATRDGQGVYVCGRTTSTSGIAVNGYQNTYGGGGDAFLARLDNLGGITWSTYFGGVSGDEARSCAVDISGQVYLAGGTSSISGIAIGGFQTAIGGGTDALVVKWSIAGTPVWSTYYGGVDSDFLVGCATDANGDLYIAGITASSTGIASTGYQNAFAGGSTDAFLAKLNGSNPACTVAMRAVLGGPYSGSMNDNLRIAGLIPATEPYAALGYAHVGNTSGTIAPGVLAVTGNNAIVDWVVVELRDANNPATRLITRSALLQRDGDVVDVDGMSPLFLDIAPGNYYAAIRHRNHLGVMTGTAQTFAYPISYVYFDIAAQAVYGTEPRKQSGNVWLLWPGDATGNGELRYTGSANDRDPILIAVGSTTPNATVTNVYDRRDTNLDGVIKYTGTANDRDIILTNVGSTTPNNTRMQQLP